jgi:hypothetical protein
MVYVHVKKLAEALNLTMTSLYDLRRRGIVTFHYPYGRIPALVSKEDFDLIVGAHLAATCRRIARAAGEDSLKGYIEEIMADKHIIIQ